MSEVVLEMLDFKGWIRYCSVNMGGKGASRATKRKTKNNKRCNKGKRQKTNSNSQGTHIT